jgi:hypothetical protein
VLHGVHIPGHHAYDPAPTPVLPLVCVVRQPLDVPTVVIVTSTCMSGMRSSSLNSVLEVSMIRVRRSSPYFSLRSLRSALIRLYILCGAPKGPRVADLLDDPYVLVLDLLPFKG